MAAAARAKYALFADHAFSARAADPAGAAPPGYTLVANREAGLGEAQRRRLPYRAIAAGLALHLAVFIFLIARNTPSKHIGTEDGLPETLNVSVVSAADLKRLSSDPFLQEAPPSPAPTPEPLASPEREQKPPTPQQPQEQQAQPAPSPPQPKASERRNGQFNPSAFIAAASEQFTSQVNQAFKAVETQRDKPKQATMVGANVKLLRPGASHVGKSDEFERAVVWALGATKPVGNGKWGSVIVTFVVAASGQVDGLKLLKTSGDNWLDEGALMAVRQARMPVPPSNLPLGDRTFNVEYISLPGR